MPRPRVRPGWASAMSGHFLVVLLLLSSCLGSLGVKEDQGRHAALPQAAAYSQFPAPEAAMADIALAGGEVPLSLSDTLAIAGGMRFYPLVQCVPQMVVPKDTSFLGPLQKMQTGDVLQAFYRFKRSDCGVASEAQGGGSSGGTTSSETRGGGDAAGSDGSSSSSSSAVPLLILLPGLGAAMSSFGPDLLGKLSCSREIVLMEQRGAALSVDYATEPLTYYTMADSVLQLADALNLTQPDILGWSTGGDIALLLAALHGGRVGRVIALGAMGGGNRTVLPDLPDIFDPASFSRLSLAQQMALLFPPQDLSFQSRVCEYLGAVVWMPNALTQVNSSVQEAQYLADKEFTTVDPTVWDALPGIDTPVLLVTGTLDAVVPPVNTDLIAGQIPGAQVLRISGWGHGLVVGDAANQLAQAVDSFLGPGDPGGP
ncbi:hypothetical protein ABPG77_004585 [Micractinium sp. CCAP 211/92]